MYVLEQPRMDMSQQINKSILMRIIMGCPFFSKFQLHSQKSQQRIEKQAITALQCKTDDQVDLAIAVAHAQPICIARYLTALMRLVSSSPNRLHLLKCIKTKDTWHPYLEQIKSSQIQKKLSAVRTHGCRNNIDADQMSKF